MGATDHDKNAFSVMKHEYNEEDSVDSFDSDYKHTNVGNIEIDPKKMKGDYLPDLRKHNELTMVPIEPIMQKQQAPNLRLESIAANLTTEYDSYVDETT